MEDEVKNKDTAGQNGDGTGSDGDAQKREDAAITNEALKELLKENAETIKSLKEELQETKKMNAKMVAILDVSGNKRDDAGDMKNILLKYGGRR